VDGARWVQLGHGRFAIVDALDFVRVSEHLWAMNRTLGYATSRAGGAKMVYLHRFVMGVTDRTQEVDHKDFDGLNCRRENLRVTSRAGNVSNGMARSSTGFRGVYWPGNRLTVDSKILCRAQIRTPDGVRSLGCFSSLEDAARAYDDAARVCFGGMARLNFPGPGELPARSGNETVVVPERLPSTRNWDEVAGTRRCTDCGNVLPLDAFSKNAQSRSGRRPECHECEKTRRHTRRSEKKAQKIACGAVQETRNADAEGFVE